MRYLFILIFIFSTEVFSDTYNKVELSEIKKELSREIFKKLEKDHYLKKIKKAGEANPVQSGGSGIDFAAENRAIRKSVGQFDIEDAQQGKLSKGQLKKLSAANRG